MKYIGNFTNHFDEMISQVGPTFVHEGHFLLIRLMFCCDEPCYMYVPTQDIGSHNVKKSDIFVFY